jgi:hypothetical protein
MIRVVIECLLVFLLPAALYVSFTKLRSPAGTRVVSILNQAPLVSLCLLGAGLMTAILIAFGNVGDGKPGQTYEPAIYKDGKVIPGRMK